MKKLLSYFFITILLLFPNVTYASGIEDNNWNEETIYNVVIDRYNNGDPKNDRDTTGSLENKYFGGDFVGITKQLTHIQELGFTTIGLSPVFLTGYEGYEGKELKDYYKHDSHFGTEKELKQLVKTAHNMNMSVILDIPYVEATSSEFSKLVSHWITKTKVDGIRLYEVDKKDSAYWGEVVGKIKEENESIYIIGEYSQGKMVDNHPFDNVFLEPFQQEVVKAFSKPDESLSSFLTVLENIKLEDSKSSVVYLDSRETDRFARYTIKENYYPEKRLKLALGALFTSPGIPAVYYGTEIGVNGERGISNQPIMNFQAKEELIEHIQDLQALRSKYKVLTHGTYEVLYEKEGFAVIKREYKDETFIIGINNTSKDQKIMLTKEDIAADMELRGLFKDDSVKYTKDGYPLVINRETVNILALGEERGINVSLVLAIVLVNVAFISFLLLVWMKSRKEK